MSEGGRFPWKVQKILMRGPVADYSTIASPLPPPPSGKQWIKEGSDWKLVDVMEEPELAAEQGTETVSVRDDEWEMLSDKVSASSAGIVVAKAGSVRSLNTMDGNHSSSTCSSVPFKMQRTHSSSTIDSNDHALGPAGKGILGVDYVEHVILPSDTLQGICIAYKINATRLRQANHFSGQSLQLAPKKLVIPLSKKALRSGFIRVQDTDAKEYKLHAFLAEFPDLSTTEAKAYLELADWDLPDAVRSAKEDNEWELEDSTRLRAGQIHIRVNRQGFNAQGAGLSMPKSYEQDEESPQQPPAPVKQVTHAEAVPDEMTKTVKAKDVYHAAPQHDHFGLELQSLSQPLLPKD